MKKRTLQQNRSLHKGCQEIADVMIEHGVSLNVLLQNIQVRPTMYSVKDVFRAMAKEKYGVDSTADLEKNQINPIWEEMIKAIGEITGVHIDFPSRESMEETWQGYY